MAFSLPGDREAASSLLENFLSGYAKRLSENSLFLRLGNDGVANAAAMTAAIAYGATTTPNGSALSATNRFGIFYLGPAPFTFPTHQHLVNYVDIIRLGFTNKMIHSEVSSPTFDSVWQAENDDVLIMPSTNPDVILSGFTIQQNTATKSCVVFNSTGSCGGILQNINLNPGESCIGLKGGVFGNLVGVKSTGNLITCPGGISGYAKDCRGSIHRATAGILTTFFYVTEDCVFLDLPQLRLVEGHFERSKFKASNSLGDGLFLIANSLGEERTADITSTTDTIIFVGVDRTEEFPRGSIVRNVTDGKYYSVSESTLVGSDTHLTVSPRHTGEATTFSGLAVQVRGFPWFEDCSAETPDGEDLFVGGGEVACFAWVGGKANAGPELGFVENIILTSQTVVDTSYEVKG